MPAAPTFPAHVEPAYVHYRKQVTPGPPLHLGSSLLKWYEIARAEAPVAPDIRGLAVDFLERQSAGGLDGLAGDLGFVLLHRCGEEFHFLIVCTWRGCNEAWETVYAKPDRTAPDFAPWPREHLHKPTYCVWEMAAVWHESQAWSRFLGSARDQRAVEAYLADRLEGPV